MVPRNIPGSESILSLLQEMRSDYEIVTNPKSRFNIQEEFEGLAAYGLSAKDNNADVEGRELPFSYENEVGGSGSKFRRDFTSQLDQQVKKHEQLENQKLFRKYNPESRGPETTKYLQINENYLNSLNEFH